MADQPHDHAVVLGAGIAGLLAATVLTEAFRHVTVVDRDELAPGSLPRRGAPQGRHVHALLARGRQVLDALHPGLSDELTAAGAPCGDALGDARLLFGGHRLARAASDLTVVSASRPLIEDRIRARVRALPGVTVALAGDCVGLQATPDGRRVRGLRLVRRAAGSADEAIEADLVVDATGRRSRAPAWLAALGMPAPAEDRLPVDVAYATRTYRLPDDALDGDLACVHGPSAGSPRGGALARVEGDRWMVTLYGLCGDRPPTDPDGFDAFARSLRVGDIHEALRLGDPVDDPTPFRYPADVRRRFERARRLPAGFVVLGDALCSLNPVYGQGMTVAALHALALRDCLRRHGEVVPRAVHSAAARATDAAWAMATGADLALPEVEGRRGPQVRLTNAYLGRLLAAAAHDPVVAVAFTRVTGLVDAPTSLLRPALAARVLRPRRRTHSPGHPPAAPARSPKAGAVAEGRP